MKVSVALCTYNGEKFLRKQIDSILDQTKTVNEIVICDDCSKDNTVRILNSYKEKHPEIFRIFINKENLCSVKNFEKAISLCTHEIIFLSDQDDIWNSEKVEIFLRNFKTNTEIAVIASNGFVINDKDEVLDVLTIWDVVAHLRKQNANLNYYQIINISGNIATGATMAMRKDFVRKILPFPVIPDFHHDEWIALLASVENKFDFIDDKTIFYRKHNDQQVGGISYENSQKRRDALIKYFAPDFDDKSFSNLKFLLKRVGTAYAKNKDLNSNGYDHTEIFAHNLQYFKNLFFVLKRDMKEKYPIKTFFLDLTDKITNKRQLH